MRRLLVTFVAVTVVTACGDSPTSPGDRSGSLSIHMTDSPFSEAQAVLITFSEVSVHQENTDWTVVPFAAGATSRTCDLKQLEGAQDILGTEWLTAGRYTQIRLLVTAAALYDAPAAAGPCAGTIDPPGDPIGEVEIPSGEVKLNRPFELAEESTTTIVLDFDGDQSIHETGNGRYIMRPVISVASVQ